MVTKYQCLRSISDASFDSDLSNDYAIPPDASTMSSLAPLPSTPSRILMSQDNISSACNSPARKGTQAFNNAEKALEKSGYLTKLGGKIKSWRKRYFVLKNGTLSYWKSQVSLINIRLTQWEIFFVLSPFMYTRKYGHLRRSIFSLLGCGRLCTLGGENKSQRKQHFVLKNGTWT